MLFAAALPHAPHAVAKPILAGELVAPREVVDFLEGLQLLRHVRLQVRARPGNVECRAVLMYLCRSNPRPRHVPLNGSGGGGGGGGGGSGGSGDSGDSGDSSDSGGGRVVMVWW